MIWLKSDYVGELILCHLIVKVANKKVGLGGAQHAVQLQPAVIT